MRHTCQVLCASCSIICCANFLDLQHAGLSPPVGLMPLSSSKTNPFLMHCVQLLRGYGTVHRGEIPLSVRPECPSFVIANARVYLRVN